MGQIHDKVASNISYFHNKWDLLIDFNSVKFVSVKISDAIWTSSVQLCQPGTTAYMISKVWKDKNAILLATQSQKTHPNLYLWQTNRFAYKNLTHWKPWKAKYKKEIEVHSHPYEVSE